MIAAGLGSPSRIFVGSHRAVGDIATAPGGSRPRLSPQDADANYRKELSDSEVKAVRELADRLTAELLEARRELAESRRPWLVRVLAALRR